jgi:hypothetical protein
VAVEIHFLPNLRAFTIDRTFRRRLRPRGYLAPPAYLTNDLRAKAGRLRAEQHELVADNGLFDDVGRLAKAFGRQSEAIETALEARSEALGRPIRGTDLDVRTQRAIATLARNAGEATAGIDAEAGLAGQMAISPTAVIGVEDITAALWLRLGLDGRVLGDRRAELRRRNRSVARRAAEVVQSGAANGARYHAVASAVDYDSAFDAGREFAAAGLTEAAMGFGAYMANDYSVDSAKIGGRIRTLPAGMPLRYVGTALAARGFWDGWRAEGRPGPKAFHFLGLGHPIMIAVAALAARRTTLLTFDATSPILDAAQAFVYVSKPAYLKIRTWRAAQRLASDASERWRCPCGFCRAFCVTYPFDYDAGAAWFAGRTKVEPKDLVGRGGLSKAYPLLSTPTGDRRQAVEFARVGHNHWALEQITHDLREHSRTRSQLESFVDSVVTDYEASTESDWFGRAVRFSFDVARGGWP